MPGFVLVEPALTVLDFRLASKQPDKIPAVIKGTVH
jgi:hypothetical protein